MRGIIVHATRTIRALETEVVLTEGAGAPAVRARLRTYLAQPAASLGA